MRYTALRAAIIRGMKIFVAIAFIGIVASLGAAGLFMIRGGQRDPNNNNMVRALTLRIGISVFLFVMLMVLWALGWIEPTGIIPGQQ